MPEYCPKCGADISSDYKFCSKCGNEIYNLEIIDDGKIKIEETTNESKDKTEISGISPTTNEAMRYYKKYKKTAIASGFLIILLLVSIVSVFLNAQNQYNSLQYSFNSLQSQYDTKTASPRSSYTRENTG